MPTYIVTTPAKVLSVSQKRRIAVAITRTHCEVAKAPTYFAQVVFKIVSRDDYYIAGKTLKGRHIYVHGCIRTGRTKKVKQALTAALMNAVAEAANAEKHQVWVYVGELPGSQIAEFGHLLPDPGREKQWAAALPAADRKRMLALGR